jgi:phage/plasmid-like protein (TIGR03299 family)
MGHNLNFNARKGTYSFASHSEKAWHGLGTIVDKAMTSQEAIELANLDYEVAKSEVSYADAEGNVSFAKGHFATYRTDNNGFLGMVKSRYEIVQNRDAFGFFDAIIDSGEAIFETAGALGNGERIFLCAKLPDDFMVGNEKIEKYIMLTNSHDGTSSIIAGLTNIRIVCNNTLQASLRGLENKVSIDHVGGAKNKLKEASRVMGIASKYSSEVGEIFNRMVDHKMNEEQYRNFFEGIFKADYKQVENEKEASTRLKNMVEATTQFALTHPTQTTAETNGTLWGAYNTVSGYYNYIKDFNNAEDKFRSQLFGQGNTKMLKAFSEANYLINQF